MGRCQLIKGNEKFSYFGLWVGFLLIATSCGLKEEVSKRRTSAPDIVELSLFREGGCDNKPLESLSDKSPLKKAEKLRDNVYSLVTQASSFSMRYNQQFFPHIMAPQDIDVNATFVTDPLNPLVLSQKKLASELENLRARWNLSVDKELSKIEDLNDINQIHKEIHVLKRKAERFHALSCSYPTLKARANNDVRPYFLVKEKLESGFSPEDPSMESLLLSMCSEFNTPALCSMEYLMSRRQGSIGLFFQNSSEHYEKRLANFFEPHPATKWKCHKEEAQTVVTVRLLKDERLKNQLFGTYDVLKSFVTQKWSNEKIRVDLELIDAHEKEVNEKVLKVVWSPNALSFVSRHNPYVMNLSSKLNFSHLSLTFAHELGHVLGFPDCYHEFYDSKAKEIIYYALDESGKNLMCHLNGRATIQDSYLERLEEQVCL